MLPFLHTSTCPPPPRSKTPEFLPSLKLLKAQNLYPYKDSLKAYCFKVKLSSSNAKKAFLCFGK